MEDGFHQPGKWLHKARCYLSASLQGSSPTRPLRTIPSDCSHLRHTLWSHQSGAHDSAWNSSTWFHQKMGGQCALYLFISACRLFVECYYALGCIVWKNRMIWKKVYHVFVTFNRGMTYCRFSISVSMLRCFPPIIYPHKQEIRDKILLLSLPFLLTKLTLWKKLTFASFDDAKLWRIFTES